jgi:uncharacterized membrane protein (DUF485 family)
VAEQTHHLAKEQVYADLHATDEFAELRRRYRGFAIPWTVAFLSWYLLYVVMSNWAEDFMNADVIGNINVALVFGLLQFVSTFGIATLYARHANRKLDPVSTELRARYDEEVGR